MHACTFGRALIRSRPILELGKGRRSADITEKRSSLPHTERQLTAAWMDVGWSCVIYLWHVLCVFCAGGAAAAKASRLLPAPEEDEGEVAAHVSLGHLGGVA